MNSKELEDNMKFAGGLVYCGQTTGVSSVGTRIQNPGVEHSPAGGLPGCTISEQGVPLHSLESVRHTPLCTNPAPHFSSTGFSLTTRLKEKNNSVS